MVSLRGRQWRRDELARVGRLEFAAGTYELAAALASVTRASAAPA